MNEIEELKQSIASLRKQIDELEARLNKLLEVPSPEAPSVHAEQIETLHEATVEAEINPPEQGKYGLEIPEYAEAKYDVSTCREPTKSMNLRLKMLNRGGRRSVAGPFPCHYCPSTGVYYFEKSVLEKQAKPFGKPLLQLPIDYRETPSLEGDKQLNEESVFFRYGYYVNKKADLSQEQRLMTLHYLIDKGIVTKAETISFLEWLIEKNRRFPNMDSAIHRWSEDLKSIRKYIGQQ